MPKEWVLWGTKKGAEDWQEDLITSTTSRVRLEAAIAWAKANGFDRLRVSTFAGEKPDFIGALNI